MTDRRTRRIIEFLFGGILAGLLYSAIHQWWFPAAFFQLLNMPPEVAYTIVSWWSLMVLTAIEDRRSTIIAVLIGCSFSVTVPALAIMLMLWIMMPMMPTAQMFSIGFYMGLPLSIAVGIVIAIDRLGPPLTMLLGRKLRTVWARFV